MNRLKACINESVSILQLRSVWTVLLAKQVKSAPYLFNFFLPSSIKKGPNMSTPHFVNGGPSRVLSVGNSAIICSSNITLSRRHLTHFLPSFCSLLHLITQKSFLLTSLIYSSLPQRTIL